MIKYKLTDEKNQTHNEFLWTVNEWQSIDIPGNTLCTNEVIHYYDTPLTAVFLNPIHANISNPKLWEMEIDSSVAHDGLKGGTKRARLLRKIPLPEMTTAQKVRAGILCTKLVYTDAKWVEWANNWLSGKDRTAQAAWAAWAAAEAAWAVADAARAAAAEAAGAARAAEWAAKAAQAAWEWAAAGTINLSAILEQVMREEK